MTGMLPTCAAPQISSAKAQISHDGHFSPRWKRRSFRSILRISTKIALNKNSSCTNHSGPMPDSTEIGYSKGFGMVSTAPPMRILRYPVTQCSTNSPKVDGTSSFRARLRRNARFPCWTSANRAHMPATTNSSTMNHGYTVPEMVSRNGRFRAFGTPPKMPTPLKR